jgi:hypothetical protein
LLQSRNKHDIAAIPVAANVHGALALADEAEIVCAIIAAHLERARESLPLGAAA